MKLIDTRGNESTYLMEVMILFEQSEEVNDDSSDDEEVVLDLTPKF